MTQDQSASRYSAATNVDNWMQLPHPGSAILSHRLLNAVRLYDISNSGEAARGMLKQAAEEVAEMEKALAAVRRSEQQRWIPTAERKPKEGEVVVGLWESDRVTTFYENGRWWSADIADDDNGEYSAPRFWMSLPPQPDER